MAVSERSAASTTQARHLLAFLAVLEVHFSRVKPATAPPADEVAADLLSSAVSFAGFVSAIDAVGRRGFVFDLLLPVGFEEFFGENVAKIFRVENVVPAGRIVALELQGLVEELLDAGGAESVAVDVAAGEAVEGLLAAVADPDYGRHGGGCWRRLK